MQTTGSMPRNSWTDAGGVAATGRALAVAGDETAAPLEPPHAEVPAIARTAASSTPSTNAVPSETLGLTARLPVRRRRLLPLRQTGRVSRFFAGAVGRGKGR